MMVKDHGMANKELKTIADAKGLQLPQLLPEKLSGHLNAMHTLADRAFDVQYLRMMINDHEKAMQLFTDGTSLADTQLKGFAVKTLPVIKQHYEKAVEIGKQLNIDNINSGDDVLGISPSKTDKK